MKVIGWTGWDDPRYREDYLSDPLFEEHRIAVIDELRKRNYHFSGFYHQGGELGVPVFDDGDWFKVSYRTWGQIWLCTSTLIQGTIAQSGCTDRVHTGCVGRRKSRSAGRERIAGCTRTGCNFCMQKCPCTCAGCRCTRFSFILGDFVHYDGASYIGN